MKKIAMALVAFMALGMAQDAPKPDQPKQKVAKDQAEADLINSLPKEPDPTKRLAILDKWKAGYPETAFADDRELAYMATYDQAKKPKEAVATATQILSHDPDNFEALRTILVDTFQINGGKPDDADMASAEKAAGHLVNDTDAVFAEKNKPAYMTPAQWTAAKDPMKAYAQRSIGVIYMTKKDNARAETEFKKALDMNPNDSQVARWLADAILAQQKDHPEKTKYALFYYARAASFDGQGSLPAQNRTQIQGFLSRAYKTYHGSDEGFNDLLAKAKTTADPGADFKLASVSDIAEAKEKDAEAFAKSNPGLAMWQTIKTGLTGDGPDAFFDSSVKDALLPGGANGVTKFKGKIISMTPAVRPKEIKLAVEKPDVADVTLKFEMPLPGKMEPGDELSFEGVAKAYTKDPYMLTLETEKDKIEGWTGKNAPAAKKAAPKKQ
jgi:tetratricopeptide (TPR) repeat protein